VLPKKKDQFADKEGRGEQVKEGIFRAVKW
jgi:hypothetical protein